MSSELIWTSEQAHAFCVKLHHFLMPLGYDIGLTGGVLWNGSSSKDIDIIVYPLKRSSSDFDVMHRSLPNFGLQFVRLPNNNQGYADDGKKVEVWKFEGKRVDLFFLT